MTETEWLTSSDPKPMLKFLIASHANARKLRLFSALCCRRVQDRCKRKPPFVRYILRASDRAADGLVSSEELRSIEQGIGAMGAYSSTSRALDVLRAAVNPIPDIAAEAASECASSFFALLAHESIGEESTRRMAFATALQLENMYQAAIIREILGNPFRTVTVNPAWLTKEVVALAHDADERRHSHRYLLGEALQKAGCDSPEIIAHCQQHGGHAKGCWPVDLLLGKI